MKTGCSCRKRRVERMFRSSVDAFLYLLDGREQRSRAVHNVASIQVDMNHMANGVKRCSVQVMYDDGVGYGIEAYDKEADELYREAKMRSPGEHVPCLTVS